MSTEDQNHAIAIPLGQLSDRDMVNELLTASGKSFEKNKSPYTGSLVLPNTPEAYDRVPQNKMNADDTIHYISPASVSAMSDMTENEGDFRGIRYDSPSFMKFFQPPYDVGEASYASSSTISFHEPELQRTLAIVKPEAMQYQDVIVRAIIDAGFSIIRQRQIHFTPEQVSEIYSQYYGSPMFPHMVVSMSVGPILSICMGAINAITKWREMVGPDRCLKAEWFYPMSMRVRFGLREPMPDAVHVSENIKEAEKDNRCVNPQSILEPLTQDEDKVADYCNMCINPTLLNGLTDVVRMKPIDPILHLAEWLLQNNPQQPRFPNQIATLPT